MYFLSSTVQLLKRPSEEILSIIVNRQNENVTLCDLAHERRAGISPLYAAIREGLIATVSK